MALTTVRPQGMGFNTGRRNLIINGAMQVAQRGDVTGKTASTHGGPDRFYAIISSLGTWSISQDTDVPSGSGFSSSYKLACTTADASPAAGDHLMLHYRMEGQDLQQLKKGTSSAESVTLSFWVKCYKTGNFQVNLYDQDNTRIIGTTVTISTAATWEYKTLTFAGDTSGALGNDNGNSLFIEMVFDSGTNFSSGAVPTAWEAATNADRGAGTTLALGDSTSNYISFTGVQLELGENASDFEHRSFDEEWHSCQRYCTVYNVGGGNTHPQNLVSPNHTVPGAAGHVDVGNRAEWFMSYPEKRSQPTITVTDATNMRWLASGNVVQDATGAVSFPVGTGHQNANVFQNVASGIATSNVPQGWLYKGSGTNPVITIDAEL